MSARHVSSCKLPLGEEVLGLHAGDHVELSGIVYTARDEAHIRRRLKASRSIRWGQSSITAARWSRTTGSLLLVLPPLPG